MIVIKPVVIDESTLTSSTIQEPDASVGEVEWAHRDSVTATAQNLHKFDFGGGFLWAIDSTTNNIHKYTERFVFIESFDISAQVTSPNGITFALGFLYVVNATDNSIYKFNVDGTYAGFSFSVASETIVPNSIFWDGNFINVFDGSSPNGDVFTYGLSGILSGSWVVPSEAATIIINGASSDGVNAYINSGFERKLLTVSLVDYSLLSSFTAATTGGGSLSGCATNGGRLFMSDNSIVYEYSYFGKKGSGYITGDRTVKSSTHTLYESVSFNSDDPEVGAELIPPTWVEISATNRFKAFDQGVSTASTGVSPLIVEITPGIVVDSIAGLNISGATSINVVVTDPIDGVVYDQDVDMVDNSEIVDWFNYLWEGFSVSTAFALFNLPAYVNATIKVTFTGASSIDVGVLVTGKSITLGQANYGSSIQQLDFSTVEEDVFGNLTVTKRPGAKLVNYDVTVLKSQLNYVYRQLDELAAIPTVWVGTEEVQDETIVYGYYRDNNLGIDTPTLCSVKIQVRGLI